MKRSLLGKETASLWDNVILVHVALWTALDGGRLQDPDAKRLQCHRRPNPTMSLEDDVAYTKRALGQQRTALRFSLATPTVER